MTEPVNFTSATPRFGIPYLFTGQAQKEFFYNEAQTVLDAILQLSVVDVADTPPPTATVGECWIIGSTAQGDWANHANEIAVCVTDGWKFITPQEGTAAYDQAQGRFLVFANEWKWADKPASPMGGAVVDSEARAAIESLIEALRNIGIFDQN